MDIVKEFLKRGILISPELKVKINPEEVEEIAAKFDKKNLVLTEEHYLFLRGGKVKVLKEYKKGPEIKRIDNFVDFYNKRFEFLRGLLKEKLGTEKITSINKLSRGNATVIGMVREIKDNGFVIEDSSGSIFCMSEERVLEDDVLAVRGRIEKNTLIEEKIFFPDIPLNRKTNFAEDDTFVYFTDNFTEKPSRVTYIFTFKIDPQNVENLNAWVITKKENIQKGPKRVCLNLPSLVEVNGVKVFMFEENLNEIGKKLGETDEKKIITALLKRRHLLPNVFRENDPYLLKEIPDIIFTRGKESFFLNYKGVSVISVSKGGFLVNLKTREIYDKGDSV